jgi:predicted small lipoprotein YifL
MNTVFRRLAAAFLLLALTAAGACGRKTPPLVPDSPRPEAVKGLQAVTRDTVAFLSWPIPTRNIEGKNLSTADIRGFLVYRADIRSDRRRPRYKLVAELDMSSPIPAVLRDGRVFWSDHDLSFGHVYGYRVRTLSVRGGLSPFSEEARVAPLRSLAAPKGVAARAGDGYNIINWDPVTTRSDGSRYDGFVGYNIYRGREHGQYDETPLNQEPLRTNSFKDTTVVNGRVYYYMLRSVDSPALPWKESLDSGEVRAAPSDQTPPERPRGLTVVPGVGRVFLTWNENKEPDLAGYLVYRSTVRGRDYVRLTKEPLTRTTYYDETVKKNAVYYYVLTAVDRSGNESERSAEKKARVEKFGGR